MMQGLVTRQSLADALRCADPAACAEASLVLNSSTQSFSAVGALLPALQHLTALPGSSFQLTDFGPAFPGLASLRAEGCGLSDLAGLSALPQLGALWLRGNRIEDLSALFESQTLHTLDLRDNCVRDPGCALFLGHLPLRRLYLGGNPVAADPAAVREIEEALPGLEGPVLDSPEPPGPGPAPATAAPARPRVLVQSDYTSGAGYLRGTPSSLFRRFRRVSGRGGGKG